VLILGLLCLGAGLQVLPAQVAATNAPASAAAPNQASTAAAAPAAAGATNTIDVAAARFATTCAGCHSLAGVKLSGPELSPATTWPVDQLKTAIKRMEKNVGPLADDQVASLAELLKAPSVRERIKAQQERIQAQFMAKLAPPDAANGRGLFAGRVPFRNGGLACMACHTAAGAGGTLGPDLTGVFTKLGGQTPLVSAIEKANFKIMAPHYSRHPVTPQEALDLAKFFSTLAPQDGMAATRPPVVPLGAAGAAVVLAGLTLHFRAQRRQRGRDTRLQRRR
jgi:mono/diheme cytochrome c family protein